MRTPIAMRLQWAAVLLAVAGMLGFPAMGPAADSDRVFQAGAAKSNITPPLGLPIIGGWAPQPATHIHDQLWARCLVLDDGTTRLAVVVADNLGFPREVADAARRWIEDETGIPGAHVLLAATHTHSAASARTPNRLVYKEELTDYQRFIARRMADGVRCAINNLAPARIGFGRAELPDEVFNRRWLMKPGAHLRNPFGGMDQARMNPPRGSEALIEPAGPTDPEIVFVSVQSIEGQPIALLANYSLHYVGGVPAGHISADYFGVFAERIQELFGADRLDPPFVGILSNGTSGDINNINFRERGERYPPYGKMREVAEGVAQAVLAACEELDYQEFVPLGAALDDVVLKVRRPNEEKLAYLRAVLEKPEGEPAYHSRERVYAERVLLSLEGPDEVAVPVQALRVGPVGIAALPFEVFAEIGLELKERSPLKPALTISLGNGSYGYLPTPEQHELGGYETWLGTSLMEKGASVKLVDRLLEMVKELDEAVPE